MNHDGIICAQQLGVKNEVCAAGGQSSREQDPFGAGSDCFVGEHPTRWLDTLIEPQLAPVSEKLFP